MKKQWKLVLCTMSLIVFPHLGFAQEGTSSQPPMGTVTGHVYCADNQKPARFATVDLMQPSTRGGSYQSLGHGRTALDGSFIITGVPPGDYFVIGTMTGYISPVAVARMTQSPITGVPVTHVDANRASDAVISMERGATVAGRIAYDDDSPLPGVTVRLRPVSSDATGGTAALFGGLGVTTGSGGSDIGFGQTDERGVFRLSGIPPGRYSLVAMVETEVTGRPGHVGGRGLPQMMSVYAPATVHRADAQVVELHGGETIEGIDVRVALAGLHTVQGSVEAKNDGHMVNAGTAFLIDASDSTVSRSAAIDSDGSYRLEYVPAGTYTLTVQGEDRASSNTRNASKHYAPGTVSVTVGDGDVTVDPVQLSEVTRSVSGG